LGSTAGEAKCPNESPVRHSRPKLAIHQAKCFASLKVMPFSSTFQAVCAAGKSFLLFLVRINFQEIRSADLTTNRLFIFLTYLLTPCKIWQLLNMAHILNEKKEFQVQVSQLILVDKFTEGPMDMLQCGFGFGSYISYCS
jgi:hypothetical protein